MSTDDKIRAEQCANLLNELLRSQRFLLFGAVVTPDFKDATIVKTQMVKHKELANLLRQVAQELDNETEHPIISLQ